jgi:hypothetical protein
VTAYSVYEPKSEARSPQARADQLDFVKDGISWAALIVPALWLIYHRMWIELLVYLAAYAAFAYALTYARDGSDLLLWLGVAVSVLFAWEANDLRRYALERRGYRQIGVAFGRSREDAELAFFRDWLPQQAKSAPPPERPVRNETPPRSAPAEAEDVIGLFPTP